MEKDFDAWNEEKKLIDLQKDYEPLYREREIRWCRLGLNVGFEQDGTGAKMSRPVLICKAFSRHVCLVIPLTTSMKKNPYHVALGVVGERNAFAIISQLRLIDTKRLDQKISTLNKSVFEEVRKAVKGIL